jgi:hypothetical protein
MPLKISSIISQLGVLAKDFTFAVIPDVEMNPKELIETVRSSQHFNLVQSFDGYVSEVYE